jgi:hypothetical protein
MPPDFAAPRYAAMPLMPLPPRHMPLMPAAYAPL